MPLPFWDSQARDGGVQGFGGLICFLPDVSVQPLLGSRWAWDVIYLDDLRVPGLVKVDFKRRHRVDIRRANGVDGQSVTSLGYNGANITVRVRLWTPQQWIDFQRFTIPSVQPRPGKVKVRPKSVAVDYPSLAAWGCHQLFVIDVDGPRECEVHGARDIILSCSDTSPQVAVPTTTQKGGGVSTEKNAITGTSGPTPAAAPSKTINTPKLGQ
jgi:hypothetical protein